MLQEEFYSNTSEPHYAIYIPFQYYGKFDAQYDVCERFYPSACPPSADVHMWDNIYMDMS